MVASYDTSIFGQRIKLLRKSMGFTIKDVSQNTGISQSVIKLIENGKSYPRFDTLHILSSFYTLDLIELTKQCQSEQRSSIYDITIQHLIANNNSDLLKRALQIKFDYLNEHKLSSIVYKDLTQQVLFIEGLLYVIDEAKLECNNIDLAIEKFTHALSVRNPSFSLKIYASLKYLSVEYYILYAIAVQLGIKRKCELSNEILEFTLKHFELIEFTTHKTLLISKIYANLSYNYHRLDLHERSLIYANKGIEYCIEYDTNMFMPLLLGRKSIALFHVKNKDWRRYLKQAIDLLEIQGKFDMIPYYKDILAKYEIMC